jgi:hypothetical protein
MLTLTLKPMSTLSLLPPSHLVAPVHQLRIHLQPRPLRLLTSAVPSDATVQHAPRTNSAAS